MPLNYHQLLIPQKSTNFEVNLSLCRRYAYEKIDIALTALFHFQYASAQQFNNWYFGLGAGISFNPGGTITPHALTDGINTAHEGCASVSDGNANILFIRMEELCITAFTR